MYLEAQNKIANKLKELRKTSGFTINQVCEHLRKQGYDISPKTMYSYESGHRIPNTDMFLELCLYYGCKDILFEFGYKPKQNAVSTQDIESTVILKKYQNLTEYGKNIIRGALGIEKDELDDLPDTPEEFEELYPPLEVTEKDSKIG